MTWSRQVRHVFERDMRRTSLWLWLYVEVLIIAVARALEWPPVMHAAFAPVGIVVAICAVVATVRVLCADDTTRSDTFWATQPLEASSVAASKLTYVGVLLGMCAVAVLFTRSAWQMGPLLRDGAGSDLYPVLTLVLLSVALTSTVFSTMTGVSVVAAGTLGVVVVARYLLDIPQRYISAPVYWPVVTALVLACAAFIVRRYQVRETTRLSKGAVLGTAAMAMMFPAFGVRSWPGADALPHDPAQPLDSIALTLPVTTMPTCEGQQLEVPVIVAAPRGWRVDLMRPTVDITRDDGSTISLSAPNWMQLAGGHGPLLPTDLDREHLRVLGGDGDLPSLRTAIVFQIPAAESGRTCGHIKRLGMRIWGKSATGVEVMRVPLQWTARAQTSGHRARILSHSVQDSGAAIRVQVSGMIDERRPSLQGSGNVDFALFNPARGEILRLESSSSSGFSSTIALPGMQHWTSTFDLKPDGATQARIGGLAAWRDSAVLLITAPKTVGRGWLRSPTVTVPQSP